MLRRSFQLIPRFISRTLPVTRSFHIPASRPIINASFKLKFTHLPQLTRQASTHAGPAETNERVLTVLKNFDKVDTSKLALTTPFTQLGLDSLDVVEVMIALEEEFHMEIPDAVADKAQTPQEISEYIYNFLNPHNPVAQDVYSEEKQH